MRERGRLHQSGTLLKRDISFDFFSLLMLVETLVLIVHKKVIFVFFPCCMENVRSSDTNTEVLHQTINLFAVIFLVTTA